MSSTTQSRNQLFGNRPTSCRQPISGSEPSEKRRKRLKGRVDEKEKPKRTDTANGKTPYAMDSYDCGSCRERPNLLPDGTLVPCPGYVGSSIQNRMPNLLQTELSTAWSGSFLRDIIDLKKQELAEKNPECAVCDHFTECGIGCRASALIETGDIMAKDPVACHLWKSGSMKRLSQLAKAENA